MKDFFETKLRHLMTGWPLSNFSGSGMDGKMCPGFQHMSEGDAVYSMLKVIALLESEPERLAALEIFANYETENVGKDTVLYFPKLSVQEAGSR
jgi:hypothetical protein